MLNLVPSGDFSSWAQVKSNTDDIIEFVNDDPRHVRIVSTSGSSACQVTLARHWITYGSTYELTVLGKKVSGNPRIWFRGYDKDGNQVNFFSGQYKELDLLDDWKLYRLSYKINRPDIVRIDVNCGFWRSLTGEAEFKNPMLKIIDADYDGSQYQASIVAAGYVGWNASPNPEVYNLALDHGIESAEWNSINKNLIVWFKGVSSFGQDFASGARRPLALVAPYSRGRNDYAGTGMILPVVQSIFMNSVEIIWVDSTGNKVDAAAIGATQRLYCALTVLR